LHYVEVEGNAALLELCGINGAHPSVDAGTPEIVRKGERQPLLFARGSEYLETEPATARAVDQLCAFDGIARLREQSEGAPQIGAVVAGAVGLRRRPCAVHD